MRKTGSRRLPRTVWLLVALLAGAALLAARALSPAAQPPRFLLLAAERAVEVARASGAQQRAPRELREAELHLERGAAEYRRQVERFAPARSFDDARVELRLAENRARQARLLADQRADEERTGAAATLDRARGLLARATKVDAVVSRRSGSRNPLAQARHELHLAESFLRGGDPSAARLHAERAIDQGRRYLDHTGTRAARFVDEERLRRWRGWIDETVAWSRQRRAAAIVVVKDANLLTLYMRGRPERRYEADMAQNNLESKLREGDEATPEGRYRIVAKKGPGASRYHRALLLDYPNAEDRRRFEAARRAGLVPPGVSLGGSIEIHGEGGRGDDWTEGCVALRNADMDDLFDRVAVGTPVTIVGSDGHNGKFSELAGQLSNGTR